MEKSHANQAVYTKRQKAAWVAALAAVPVAGMFGFGVKTAGAAPLDALAGTIVRGEAPIIRHNTHLKGRMTIACASGPVIVCTIRARSRRTGRVRFHLRLNVKRTHSHESELFEDYSGWIRHDGKTYYLDPPCQPASPCVDG